MIRNLAYLSLSNSAQRVLGTLCFLFLLRYLPLGDFGTLNLILSIVSPIMAIISFGMASMIATEISLARGRRDEVRISELGQGLLRLNLTVGVVVTIGLFVVFKFAVTFGWLDQQYQPLFLWVLLLLLVQAASSYCEILLKSYERFKAIAVISFTEVCVRFVVIACFVLLSGLTFHSAVLAYLIARVASFLMALLSVWPLLRKVFSISIRKTRVIFSIIAGYGKWGIAQEVLTNFTESIRLWLVGAFFGTEGIALFTAAAKATSFISKAVPVSSILPPLISRTITDRNYVSTIIQKTRKFYSAYMIVASGFFALAITPLLDLLAPQYVIGAFLFQLMTLRLIVSAMFTGQPALLYAHLSQKFMFYQFMTTFVTNFMVNLLFLAILGLPGLAYAMAVNAGIVALVREWYIVHRLRYSFSYVRSMLIFDEYDRTVVLSVYSRLLMIIKKFV